MAHFLFIILHIFALIFGVVLLVITIPLHIIYGVFASQGRKNRAQMAQIAKAQGLEVEKPRESAGFWRVVGVIFIVITVLIFIGAVLQPASGN